MSSNSRSVRIPQEEWEKYRTEITFLFQDHTYAQIIDHLGKKHNFHPSPHQFGTQVQKRWKLRKNVKAELQVYAFAKIQELQGRRTEIWIDNRPLPLKKLRKTATAMATAQKRKAGQTAHVAPIQMHFGQHKRLRRTPIEPDPLAGENVVPHPASPDNIIVHTPPAFDILTASSGNVIVRTPPAFETPVVLSDNIIVRTPPALESLAASPLPSSSSLARAHPHSSPIVTFNAWFENNVSCLIEMLSVPSLDTFHPQRSVKSQLNCAGELNPRGLRLASEIELNSKMEDLANRTVSRLQDITTELAREGFIENINISPGLSKFETSFQLLLPMIELASNNLLPKTTVHELLRWISTQGLFRIVEALIDNQLPTTAAFARVLFNGSVDIGDTEIAKALLAKGVDPNSGAQLDFGLPASPLQVAIRNADADMVRLLLSFGAKVTNAPVANRRIGLHPPRTDLDLASEGPRMCVTTIELLLRHGASANVLIPNGRHFTTSVLNRALKLQEMELVKKLLSDGALTNDHHCGRSVTALQTAAKYCDSEAVKLLIDAGADLDLPTGTDYRIAQKVAKMIRNHEFFVTPLQHATKRNDIAMAKVLLDNHASVDGFDFHQFFPHGYSADRDDWGSDCSDNDLDSDFANYDAYAGEERCSFGGGGDRKDITVFEQQSQLYSPLQAAAANKSLTMIYLLLEHHPTINLMGGLGTALQVACMQKGNMEIVRLLIDKGANINSPAHTRYGQTALQAAILSGDIEVAEYLFDNKADFRAPASRLFGRTALQAAAKMGYTHFARKLIERGANVNESTSMHGENCLHFAARSGNMELACLLLEQGADVNETTYMYGESCLHFAARSGNMELACLLLKQGADVNAPHSAFRCQRTVLFDAIESREHTLVEVMLDHGADPRGDHQEGMDHEYLGTAVSNCSRDTIELLLRRGASPTQANFDNTAPPHIAVDRCSLDLVQLLLSFGPDPNAGAFQNGELPLTAAIAKEDENLVRILLDKGAYVNVNWRDDVFHRTPLAAALFTGNISILRILLAAKMNLHGEAGICALAKAIDADTMDVAQFLLSSGLRAEHMIIGKQRDSYPLATAIRRKDYAAVNMLLAHDTGFYSRDAEALEEAVKIGDLQLIRRLLSLHSALDVEEIYAEALQVAVSTRQVTVVETLITAGADVNTSHIGLNNETVLVQAIRSGSLAMVRLIIQKGAHINSSFAGRQETTPLQWATELGNAAIIDLLLHHGADVNAPGAGTYCRTALEGAAANGRLETVHKMLKYDKEPQTLE